MITSPRIIPKIRNFQKKFQRNSKYTFYVQHPPPPKKIDETKRKDTVEPERSQMTIRHMRIALWLTKAYRHTLTMWNYRWFATTVSQLKTSYFSGETFKGFEVLYFSMSATTTQLLSSGEFYKLRYDTIPVKSASANVSYYTSNSKMPNFELWHSCCKRAI